MRIKAKDIPENGISLSFQDSPSQWGMGGVGGDGPTIQGDISGTLKITKHNEREFFLWGEVSAETRLECSRCLKKYVQSLRCEVHADYIPEVTMPSEHEHELSRTDLNLYFYKGETVSLDEVVQNHLCLAIPMRPLCREDCRGLCPQCGRDLQDLNEDICFHTTESVDMRWSKLRDFITKK